MPGRREYPSNLPFLKFIHIFNSQPILLSSSLRGCNYFKYTQLISYDKLQ